MKTIYFCQILNISSTDIPFKCNGILFWNNLPNDIKRECNFKKFKKHDIKMEWTSVLMFILQTMYFK